MRPSVPSTSTRLRRSSAAHVRRISALACVKSSRTDAVSSTSKAVWRRVSSRAPTLVGRAPTQAGRT